MNQKLSKKMLAQVTQLSADWHKAMRIAEGRVGKTPKERLTWVLGFAKRDLSLMQPEERAMLGHEFRTLHSAGLWHAPYSSGLVMPDRLLREIHRAIRSGLAALFSERPDNEWNFPPPKTMSLHRVNPLTAKQTTLQRYYQGDEKAAILGAVYDLLVECQQTVRVCTRSRCGRPFIRVRKQTFCSGECSQAERNERKRSKKQSSK